MTLAFKDIEFRTELPEIPRAMPVIQTVAQCAPERTRPVRALAEHLQLSDLTEVDLPWGYALGSEAGQVEFFAASGAVRGRSLKVINAFSDERRDWPDVTRVDTADGAAWAIGEKSGRDLMEQSRSLLDRLGLAEDTAAADVVLGQWALLDEEGAERDSGPGRATVRFSYAYENLPFIGPGSKTALHYEPLDKQPQLARMFHVHRSIGDARSVEVGDVERAFSALLADPLLASRVRRRARVALTGVQVGLLALPADTPQRFAVPTLAVEGVIEGLTDSDGRPHELRFGRYVPMASDETLRGAGVAGAELPTSTVQRTRRDQGE
ncbi:MAG: hypothetical protein QOK10_3897 [Pseudonocardiales bacterium]|jgi:hypothetical protein|nr:hypothetical protein [Pseudonocardiales bacterium]